VGDWEWAIERKDYYSVRAHRAERICAQVMGRIDKWMSHGERMCPLCHHHYNHEPDCPYVDIKAMIAELPEHWRRTCLEVVGERQR